MLFRPARHSCRIQRLPRHRLDGSRRLKMLRTSVLADLFDGQRSCRQRSQQFGLIAGLLKPSRPIRTLQDNHLPVMNRRDIRPRCRRQQCECFASVRHRTPQPRKAEPVLASLREFPFLLRRFGPGKLEEMRRRDQTSADRKPTPLRAKIDDRRAFRPGRWESHRSSINSLVPSSSRRRTGALSVGQISSRGSRFGAAAGHRTGMRVWLNAAR
jgi:hypothetical protein